MSEVKFNSIFQDEFISVISIKRAMGFKYETDALISSFATTFFPRRRFQKNYAIFGAINVPMKAPATIAAGSAVSGCSVSTCKALAIRFMSRPRV